LIAEHKKDIYQKFIKRCTMDRKKICILQRHIFSNIFSKIITIIETNKTFSIATLPEK